MNWSAADIAILREKYPTTSVNEIGATLGRTPKSVKTKAKVIGLRKASYYWTDDQVKQLRVLHPDTPDHEIARTFNRPYGSIIQKASKLGLKKSEAYHRKCIERFKEGGMRTRLGPGHKSYRWNKGMKGLYTPGSEKGWFKKGMLNGAAKQKLLHDGAITTRLHKTGRKGAKRPYKYIRIAQGKWREFQVYVWEKHNGPVPKGMRVMFKNGDSMNCDISNLHLVTPEEAGRAWQFCDQTIASRIAMGKGRKIDRDLYNELLKRPDILELKRKQLQLNKLVEAQ